MSCVYRVALVTFRALVSFAACMLGGCRAHACMLFVLFHFVVSGSVGLVSCSVFSVSLSSLSLLLFFFVPSASVSLLCLSIIQ